MAEECKKALGTYTFRGLDLEIEATDIVDAITQLHLRMGLTETDWAWDIEHVTGPLAEMPFDFNFVAESYSDAELIIDKCMPENCTRVPCCQNLVQVRGRPLCLLEDAELYQLVERFQGMLEFSPRLLRPLLKKVLSSILPDVPDDRKS